MLRVTVALRWRIRDMIVTVVLLRGLRMMLTMRGLWSSTLMKRLSKVCDVLGEFVASVLECEAD